MNACERKPKFPIYFALVVLSASTQAQPVSQLLVAETNHSTIQFSVPISKGITRITGKFNSFSIDVSLPDTDILHAHFSAVIRVASINTGEPARDEDLRSADFFDEAKYPEITFTTSRIERKGNDYIAVGNLQMHGVSKEIQLPFSITERRDDTTIGFRCRTTIKRSDFGVGTTFKHTTDDHFIGEEIGVEIDFWTKKAKR
jgi:polyisoprenoid-binding protein YceI